MSSLTSVIHGYPIHKAHANTWTFKRIITTGGKAHHWGWWLSFPISLITPYRELFTNPNQQCVHYGYSEGHWQWKVIWQSCGVPSFKAFEVNPCFSSKVCACKRSTSASQTVMLWTQSKQNKPQWYEVCIRKHLASPPFVLRHHKIHIIILQNRSYNGL